MPGNTQDPETQALDARPACLGRALGTGKHDREASPKTKSCVFGILP
jgi:hypothetical protein